MERYHYDRYDPWRVAGRLHHDVGRLFPARVLRTPASEASGSADWIPPVDIKENDDSFVIRADVPGVDVEALEITMDKGVLSLQGARETRPEQDETQTGLQRTERRCGRFQRSFSLPEAADSDGVAADYHNGVLEITIPKRQEAAPRRIEVKSS